MGVAQQSGDEPLGHLGQAEGIPGVVERVGVAFEERKVGVHARALDAGEWLGHEACVHALALRGLLHHQAHGHDGVGHGERVGVAQVDLVLARGVLVLGVLDGDAHLLQGEDAALAEVARHVGGGELEVGAGVEGHGRVRRVGVGEVEVLDLGGREEGEPLLPGAVEGPAQGVSGAAFEGSAVEVEDVAEDPGHGCVVGMPGEDLERLGVGPGEHVALLDPGEAVDSRTVEGHALLEGVLELGRRDGEGLGRSQDVGEPQLHEADGSFLDGPEHVLLLAPHVTSAGRSLHCRRPAPGLGRVSRALKCRRLRRGRRTSSYAVYRGAMHAKSPRGKLAPGDRPSWARAGAADL